MPIGFLLGRDSVDREGKPAGKSFRNEPSLAGFPECVKREYFLLFVC
ncbi:MAG: hypothetical protein ABDK92_10530 [Atribacterota bacterium]